MNIEKKQILLANDDGINAPGLWAAASALAELGYVTVAAPREQASGTGRSFPKTSDGRITSQTMQVNGQDWQVYAIGGSPSQTVLHALLEILPEKPDLVVSGINYGENLSSDITYSGTVGAAMECAAMGVPSMAVSMQVPIEDWEHGRPKIDYDAAAHFTQKFAKIMLTKQMLEDVDLLNIVVPTGATTETPWRITRLYRRKYFNPYVVRSGEGTWDDSGRITARISIPADLAHDTDIYTVHVDKLVSVTPVSIDLTSRVDFEQLTQLLGE